MKYPQENEEIIHLDYIPHKNQIPFHLSKARYKILVTGRRFGKTIAGANEVILKASQKQDSLWWVVAPIFSQTRKCWRTIMSYLPKEIIQKINRSEMYIELVNGSSIWFKSADNPDGLRGEGLDGVWIDEGAMIKLESWEYALVPALMDKKGNVIITTTPKGYNWVMELFNLGQDDNETEYESWNYGSVDNPYIDPNEIEKLKQKMREKVIKQEIYGEFIEDVGAIFEGINSCIGGDFEEPMENHQYYVGVDLAKHVDYTVIVVMNKARHVVAFQRLNKTDWTYQKKIITDVAKKYNNAKILLDSTGLGDPIFDDLLNDGLNIEGYKFTRASKMDLIENLSAHISQRTLSYPNIPILVNELKIFGFVDIGRFGQKKVMYSAPEGYHDDCVIALALAVKCVDSTGNEGGWALASW